MKKEEIRLNFTEWLRAINYSKKINSNVLDLIKNIPKTMLC